MFLYVNSIAKLTGMKNTGLKLPEKDQIYVSVRFSNHYRAKIIGKSFSILRFKCLWVNTRVVVCKKLEDSMHVHVRHFSIASIFDLFLFLSNILPNFKLPNLGAAYLWVWLICWTGVYGTGSTVNFRETRDLDEHLTWSCDMVMQYWSADSLPWQLSINHNMDA